MARTVGQSEGASSLAPEIGHWAVAILGRGRLPSDVAAEIVAALAEEPRLVVCDLDGLADAGPAVAHMFTPVTDYLRIWPGTVVLVIAHDPLLRRQLAAAEEERLLVRGSLAAGVADAEAVMPRVQRSGLRLAPMPSQVPPARAFVTQTLRSWGLAGVVGSAVLVVSELVTNSVVHAGSVLHLAVSAAEGRVRVAVHDHGGGAPRAREERLAEHVGGRGLQLVRAVTRGWGVLPARHGGKTVWAVLDEVPTAEPVDVGWRSASPRTPPTSVGPLERVHPRLGEEAGAVLASDWAGLIALLDGRPDADPMTRVQRLCGLCVPTVGVSGAALGIATDGQRSTVAASDEMSNRLQDLQADTGEGPSIEAYRLGRSVVVPDLLAQPESRWPWFTSAAVEAGARAMFALPVRVGAVRMGALTLYRTSPGGLGAEQLQDASTLAEAASVLLALKQPGAEAAEAFMWVIGDRSRFRAEVYQAVGATTVHLGVDAAEAFARISAHSFATGQPIAEVAAAIMGKRLRLEPA